MLCSIDWNFCIFLDKLSDELTSALEAGLGGLGDDLNLWTGFIESCIAKLAVL